jgi:5-methylcytosine-specific restriction enzyme subunit McrC
VIPIDAEGAHALELLGEQLVSQEGWWGDASSEMPSATDDEIDDGFGDVGRRSAIRCQMGSDGRWRIRVSNRIGVVSVGDLQLRVMPKLPVEHVMWLLSAVPELGSAFTSTDAPIVIESGGGFWEVLAHSFLWSTERLLRSELIKDYREHRDELPYARGRIRLVDTTRSLMRGRMLLALEFEEFSVDTPLNRILRAAARRVAATPILSRDVRRRALRIVARTEDVGDLREQDVRAATIDRRTSHYRGPIALASLLLRGETVSWLESGLQASAFLIRTPDLVERGVRQILDQGLRPMIRVKKTSLPLESPAGEKVNPDLVFGMPALAVGDVKYKLAEAKWARPDVYEVVAFAVQCGVRSGSIVDFSTSGARRVDFVIGDRRVRHLAWDLRQQPEEAAARLVTAARGWLENAEHRREITESSLTR